MRLYKPEPARNAIEPSGNAGNARPGQDEHGNAEHYQKDTYDYQQHTAYKRFARHRALCTHRLLPQRILGACRQQPPRYCLVFRIRTIVIARLPERTQRPSPFLESERKTAQRD